MAKRDEQQNPVRDLGNLAAAKALSRPPPTQQEGFPYPREAKRRPWIITSHCWIRLSKLFFFLDFLGCCSRLLLLQAA